VSKRVVNDNVRVEVYADIGWRANPNNRRTGESVVDHRARIADDLRSTCETIASEIRRHVDDVASVVVNYDRVPVCEHCGADWTEDSPDYNGGCCRKDQDPKDARETECATDSATPQEK